MCIFQSEQVIKLRFWYKKVTSLIFKSYKHIYLLFTYLIFFHMWRNSSRCDNLGKLGQFYCFSHSSSCPRLGQEETPWFHWKKRMANEFARSQSIGLSCVGRDVGFKYREGSWHSSLKCLNLWRKSCAKFDSLLLNIQDATVCSLEKLNFKV